MSLLEGLKELYTVHSTWGLVHLISANVALLLGTLVLLNKKGTPRHILMARIYLGAMVFTNGTSFALNNFGGFSPFHWLAVFSLASVLIGYSFVLRKKGNWLPHHVGWMSGSVVGLYAALAAEISVRFFDPEAFWWVVVLASSSVIFIGIYFIIRFQVKTLPSYFKK